MVTLVIIVILANLGAVAVDHLDYPDMQACQQAKAQLDDIQIHIVSKCIKVDLD